MATQRGTLAVQFGIPGTANTLTVTSVKGVTKSTANTWTVWESAEYRSESKRKDIVANTGETTAVVFYDRWEYVAVTAVPAGANAADALAIALNFPGKLDEVEISNTSGDSQITGSNAGNNVWLVDSASKRYTPEGDCVATFNLKRKFGGGSGWNAPLA